MRGNAETLVARGCVYVCLRTGWSSTRVPEERLPGHSTALTQAWTPDVVTNRRRDDGPLSLLSHTASHGHFTAADTTGTLPTQ